MALLLSEEKQMHLSHVILGSFKNIAQASFVGDQTQALREVKKVIAEHMKVEAELEQKFGNDWNPILARFPKVPRNGTFFTGKPMKRNCASESLGNSHPTP